MAINERHHAANITLRRQRGHATNALGWIGQIAITGWALFLAAWLLTGTSIWFWVLLDSAPTIVLIVVPVLLFGTVPFIRSARWAWSATLVAATAVCFPRTDAGLQFFPRSECKVSKEAQQSISILTWNTEFWGEEHPAPQVGASIIEARADIVALQEVQTDVRKKYVTWTPSDFPTGSYSTIIRKGELAIATNFDVLADNRNEIGFPYLWVDIVTPSRDVIRVVNVHIPVHLSLSLRPGDGDFLDFVRTRFSIRNQEFETLRAFIDKSPNPVILAGDLNSTAAMAPFRSATRKLCDSIHAAGFENPMTWSLFGLPLWRPDYILTSPEILALDYEILPMNDNSDHRAIRVLVGL